MKRKKVEILEIRSISILSAIKVIYPIALIFYFIVFFFLGLFVLSVVIKINSLLGIYDAVLVEPGSSLSILRLLLFSILNSFLLSTFMVVVFIVVLSFYNFFVSIAGGIKVEVLKSSTETGGKPKMQAADKEIRVRFAPSPTGVLHLGGARTAIHNWLFARSKGGKFLLRIEDTDVARSNRATVSQIIDSLRWLGLNWDEKIVFQSERLDIYRKKAEELIEKGLAYRCFCDVKEIEEAKKDAKSYKYSGKCRSLIPEEVKKNLRNGKPYAVRIKIDPGKISWKDLIYGEIEVDTEELDDFIILRSNGMPTYHFAVVVDDIYMKITHVIRGEDHIPNTPKHIVLYKAFNQRVPKFAHLPLLLGVDGKRLSKRHGATGVDEYREMGFLPEAVFNYLAIIGTSISADNQILTAEELINRYNVKKVARKSAVFDVKKLEWMNKKHISKKSAEELYNVVVQIFQRYELLKAGEVRKDYILNIINLMKGRVVKLTDFAKWGKYFFLDPADYDSDALSKYWDDKTCEFLKVLKQALKELQKFDSGSIEGALRKTAERLGIKAAQLIHPFRIALTGLGVSPDIFEIASLLKKEAVLRRLDNIINFYS